MPRVIWEFQFEIVSPLHVSMPKGAEILTAQDQGGVGCLWAIVEPENWLESRYFEIFGTGQPIHEDQDIERRYVGTLQQPPFVWHVFERLRPDPEGARW